MIETENLVKTFDGKKIVLNGISEKIQKNEKVVVIGRLGKEHVPALPEPAGNAHERKGAF